ncbi:(Trans)glycosidase [Apiospora saccharicola]|uniref:(Trans)glycosidase n=1 Tax=Apiospora saccharicola TaxID=335842 RepID=A0ABR1VL48_9PEZI
MSVELGGECEWRFDMAECRRYLLAPVDGCDCGGAGSKQGGIVRNNCITWRLDPNYQSGSVCL